MVNVLLVGSEIEEAAGCSCASRTAICKPRNAAKRMMRENRITEPPRNLVCDKMKKDERNSGRTLRSKHMTRADRVPCKKSAAIET